MRERRLPVGEANMTKRPLLTIGLVCVLAACSGGNDENQAAAGNGAAANGSAEASQNRQTIGDALAASADHSAFVQALQSAGLTETLRGAGPYTVFAPTNAAFDAIPEDVRRGLTSADQRERLTSLLSYHIVSGTVTAEDLRRAIDRAQGHRAELATVTGQNLTITRDGEAMVISDAAGGRARISRPDQNQANGVVHSIDAVLMPSGS
jgi:uncharacterized surface protein with fasciclin (FAS1) repeats